MAHYREKSSERQNDRRRNHSSQMLYNAVKGSSS
jgi:hypothetical protein